MSVCRLLVIAVIGCGGGGHAGDDASSGDDSSNSDGMHDGDTTCGDPAATFTVHAQPIASTGLDQPVYVQQAPGNDTDLYVVEKPGKIVIVRNGSVLATPFLDVTALVNIPFQDAEGGLLGLAFAHDYATSGRFFIYLSVKDPAPHVAVQEYHRSAGNPDVSDPTAVQDLIDIPHSGGNSLGGTIAFGPDGYLWLGTGDAAAMPSPAPDPTTQLGKMLRIDIDHPSTPPPNGIGGTADPFVWDYGLRNPYRFSFDRTNHDLYIADAGEDLFEEVDIEAPAQGHFDYGWDRMEGTHCRNGTQNCPPASQPPKYDQQHGASFSVIIGGASYRGTAIPAMRCHYIFAVFGAGRILSFVWDGNAVGHFAELSDMFSDVDVLQVTSIVEDNAGELYMTSMTGNAGNLYKIVPD
jgi:glucose/arabinose dehydrogenase